MLLFFRNSPLAGSLVPIGSESRQIRRLSARNICSDYHGREETIDIAKDGEFICDDLILCPQLPAKEKAAAQAGAPPIDFSALGSAGGCRRGLLLRALHRHCQGYVISSSSTTRSRVFRCRLRRTHRPAPRSTSRTRLRCGQWAHRDSGSYASAATAVVNDGTGADADVDADAGLTDLTEATGSGASGSRAWVSDQDRHRTPARSTQRCPNRLEHGLDQQYDQHRALPPQPTRASPKTATTKTRAARTGNGASAGEISPHGAPVPPPPW